MPPLGHPPRRNKHLFTAPALGLAFSTLGLLVGVQGTLEASDNPAPTIHPCRDGLAAELGPGAWVDVSACEPDFENSVLVFDDRGSDSLLSL
ncbi:MAG: hypothetical protein ACRBN8_46280 [Nannocystales bacterium]